MKVLRRVLLLLMFSLLFGLAVGTLLRLRLEQPVTYIGSAAAALPFHVVDTGAAVLDAGHHEEQV